jgi:intracellular multiplication protein IcmP
MYLSPRNKFKTQYTLEGFIKTQAKMWPVIAPIVKFNPIHSSARAPGDVIPDKMPLFAEALSPEEWIAFHRINVVNNIPDRDATRRAFLLQLGPRWTGSFSGQPMYMKALIAACALKGAQHREDSDNLLGRIALCWSAEGGLQLDIKLTSEIEKILRDDKLGGPALGVANNHAYRTTAMLGMLLWARSRGGVLAPAQFLWLRGTDRALWYALNNLGRRAFLPEGAGAMAHFMAEQNARKALPIPRIDTAIVTLNQYMAERGLPIPPREGAAS